MRQARVPVGVDVPAGGAGAPVPVSVDPSSVCPIPVQAWNAASHASGALSSSSVAAASSGADASCCPIPAKNWRTEGHDSDLLPIRPSSLSCSPAVSGKIPLNPELASLQQGGGKRASSLSSTPERRRAAHTSAREGELNGAAAVGAAVAVGGGYEEHAAFPYAALAAVGSEALQGEGEGEGEGEGVEESLPAIHRLQRVQSVPEDGESSQQLHHTALASTGCLHRLTLLTAH